jgi:hypothetical protein
MHIISCIIFASFDRTISGIYFREDQFLHSSVCSLFCSNLDHTSAIHLHKKEIKKERERERKNERKKKHKYMKIFLEVQN